MRKYVNWLAGCFLLCMLCLLPSSKAEAAVNYTRNYVAQLESGAFYLGYDYAPEISYSEDNIKSVKWKVSDSKKASISYSKKSLSAAVVFKKAGSFSVTRTVKQKTGKTVKTTYNFQVYNKSTWIKSGEYTYYYLKEGGYAVDQWIGDRYVNDYGHWNPRFEKTAAGVRYLKSDGTYAVNEWIQPEYSDYEYYFGSDGLMVTDAWVDGSYVQENGKIKYGLVLTETGLKVNYSAWYGGTDYEVNTWETLNGKKIYFGSDGNQVKGQWLEIDGSYYYFDEDGYMAASTFVDGYYVGENGRRVKSQRAGDYYINSKGIKAAGRWIGGYYVDSEGKILKDQWIDGKYVGLNGKRIKNMRYTSGKIALKGVCLTATERQLKKLVSIAKKEVGKPYIWGGNGPDGYDCSGFVCYCYRKLGYTLPRSTYYMYNYGVKVDPKDVSEWQIGDLLINRGTADGRGGGHVVMYIGNGKVIESTGGGVQISSAYKCAGNYDYVRRILYVK